MFPALNLYKAECVVFSRTSKGFSLIEVAVTTAVIAIGLSAFASLPVTLLRESNQGKRQLLAINSAYDHIERLRTQPYDDIESDLPANPNDPGVAIDCPPSALFAGKDCFVRQTIKPPPVDNDTKIITVTFSWSNTPP